MQSTLKLSAGKTVFSNKKGTHTSVFFCILFTMLFYNLKTARVR